MLRQWHVTSLPPLWARDLGRMLLMATLCFLTRLTSSLFWSADNYIFIILLGPAVVLCCLRVTAPGRLAVNTLACSVGMYLAMMYVFHVSAGVALLESCGMVLPIYLVARWMRSDWPLRKNMHAQKMTEILKLIGLIGILLPLLHVSWQQLVIHLVPGRFDRLSWTNIGLAYSSGYLLLTPAVSSIYLQLNRTESYLKVRPRYFLVPVAIVAALWILWARQWDSFFVPLFSSLAIFPLLIWTLVLLGIAGACGTMLAISLLGMTLTLKGFGPFVGLPLASATLSMQTWTLLTGVSILICSVLVEEKRTGYALLAQAYRQLSDMTGRVIIVREEERTRIARELHDNINQSLAAAAISLSAIRKRVEDQEGARILEVQQDLQRVSDDIRDISHELHPSILRFTGLAPALRNFCRKHSEASHLEIRCTVCGQLPLDPKQELALFRIVQESIQNIEKHANASSASVSLSCDDQGCELLIGDNGIGPPNARLEHAGSGLGVISMMERARLLGGTLAMLPAPSGGTVVRVLFPLKSQQP